MNGKIDVVLPDVNLRTDIDSNTIALGHNRYWLRAGDLS